MSLSSFEAEIFAALSHPVRLEILELLRDGEQCVCHLQAVLDQRQAYISQHLNLLKQAGLLVSRKEGHRIYYQIAATRILPLLDAAEEFIRQREKLTRAEIASLKSNLVKPACTCPQCTTAAVLVEGSSR